MMFWKRRKPAEDLADAAEEGVRLLQQERLQELAAVVRAGLEAIPGAHVLPVTNINQPRGVAELFVFVGNRGYKATVCVVNGGDNSVLAIESL